MLPDTAVLLAPIDGAAPCGTDLSFSDEFDRIQDARRADDDSLDAGEWVRELKRADWPRVVERSVALLSTRTKDLRLAVWLTEALAKTEGFAGLARGLDIVRGLIETHWQNLHPMPEAGDDVQERSGNLAWLFSRSAELLREIPLVRTEHDAFCWNDFESARGLQMQMDRDPDRASALAYGRVTVARLQAVQADTSREFFEQQCSAFPQVGVAERALERVIAEKFGANGPSAAAFRDAFAAVTAVVERIWQQAGLGGTTGQPADTGTSEIVGDATFTGVVHSRQHALQMLRVVADYFRRTEPHSPVTYLAEKAARWGELPLHAWLRQVIHDPGVLGRLEELLGTEAINGNRKD